MIQEKQFPSQIKNYGSKDDIIEQIWTVSNDLDKIRLIFIQKGIDLKGTDIIQRLGLDIKHLDSIEIKIKSL